MAPVPVPSLVLEVSSVGMSEEDACFPLGWAVRDEPKIFLYLPRLGAAPARRGGLAGELSGGAGADWGEQPQPVGCWKGMPMSAGPRQSARGSTWPN